MDFSKSFDYIPHDLLTAKLHANGFSQKMVTSFLSYFLTLLSGVPEGSILSSVLFNIFLNDILSTLKLSALFNFADDNTISTSPDNIDHLLLTLKHESELAVKWFTKNQIIVNPDKFQNNITKF